MTSLTLSTKRSISYCVRNWSQKPELHLLLSILCCQVGKKWDWCHLQQCFQYIYFKMLSKLCFCTNIIIYSSSILSFSNSIISVYVFLTFLLTVILLILLIHFQEILKKKLLLHSKTIKAVVTSYFSDWYSLLIHFVRSLHLHFPEN